jgi:hypothetical protein
MAFTPWQRYITDGEDVIPGADVEVRRESDGALATIYSDPGGTSKSNPFQSDAEGLARFYAAAGRYKITATSGTFTSIFRHEPVGEAQGYDVGNTTDELLLTRIQLDNRFEPLTQDNLSATSDPTVNDDANAGYAPRSLWFNTSSGEMFMLLDATAGAADWKKTTLTLDELGSAATKDVGTGDAQVPQNSDLNVLWNPISSDTTLGAANNRQALYIKADVTITLPIWANVDSGYVVEVILAGNYTVTLATQSSDSIQNSDTSMTTDGVIARTPTTDTWTVRDADNFVKDGDNVSVLNNDANYVASGDNVSALTNDSNYVTDSELNISWLNILSNTTLDSSNNRQTLWVTSSNTVTLPKWANVASGYYVDVRFSGGHTLTINTQTGESILNNNTTMSTPGVIIKSPAIDTWLVIDRDELVRSGDNISVLTNDANYQNASDVRTNVKEEAGTSYTYALSDENTYIEHNNSSAITVTIPTNSAVPFLIGAEIAGEQTGTGQVTIQGDTGVTVQAPGGRLSTVQQYSPFSLIKVGTDEWRVHGDMQ